MNLIFFDLEGPLSPQDNAYELMKLFPGGDRLFELISRYDDLLALEGRPGYEPGDTLALIVPFLVAHGIGSVHIDCLAEGAGLVQGARELVSWLKARGWGGYCISTSYERYARRICQRVGIPLENLSCTAFDPDECRRRLSSQELGPVAEVEDSLASLEPERDDHRLKELLDAFYWRRLPGTYLGELVAQVRPMGGGHKVEALQRFAAALNQPLSQAVAVGDSITDFKMLSAVDRAGGLAVAFNANEYALPYATCGLASTHLSDLEPLLVAWEEGGRPTVEALVREREKAGGAGNRANFQWLAGRGDLSEPLAVHKRIRRLVREAAAGLG